MALLLALASMVAGPARATIVTGLRAAHHDGQTFLTWKGLPGHGWRYRVYASSAPLLSSVALVNASMLGQSGDSSACDRRITRLLGIPCSFRIDSLAAPLPLDAGLFVVTAAAAQPSWYAVTADSLGLFEDRTMSLGANTLAQAVNEVPALPGPIWQRDLALPVGEDRVLWGGPESTPFRMPLWPVASTAFHVGVLPGRPGGPLELGAHGRGGSFLNSLFGAGLGSETVLSIDDYLENDDLGDFYLGYASGFDPTRNDNLPPTSGTITPWTERRVLTLMDWSAQRFHHDPERVYCLGASMGGTFAVFMALHHPDLIAGAFAFVPKLLFGYTPDPSPSIRSSLDRMWGAPPTDLPVLDTGTSIGVWMDGRAQVRANSSRGSAPVMGFVGRNDVVVGWPEKIPYFAAAESSLAGGYWFWDSRTHDASRTAPWAPMQDTRYLGRFRRDRSWPALSHCSASSAPGDGSATSGDTLGQLNAFVEWDTLLTDQPVFWQVTLRLRDLASRVSPYPAPESLTVDVTPRRLQRFHPIAGGRYTFSVKRTANAAIVQTGAATADGDGIVTMRGVKIHRTGSILTLQSPEFDAVPAAPPPAGTIRMALSQQPLVGSGVLDVQWAPGRPGTLECFDAAGRRRTMPIANAASADTRFTIAAGSLAPGLWFIRARQGAASAVLRFVVLR